MYEVFTPAQLLDAAPAAAPRPRLAPAVVARTTATILVMLAVAWVAHRAGLTLRHLCGADSSFAGGCTGDTTLRDQVFEGTMWTMLLGTSPAAGMAMRRWWAWILPLAVVGAGYALVTAHAVPHL
jgi:hypothetical protein